LKSFAPYQIAMLIGGIVLFLLSVALIIFATVKQRSTKTGLVVLPLAVLMIGFPAIKNFEGLGFKLEVAVSAVETKAAAVEENPDDAAAKKELEGALNNLEANMTTNTASANVAETIAHGNLVLGKHDSAIKWARVAVAKDPNSTTARILLDRAKVSEALPRDSMQPLPPVARSNLSSAVIDLDKHQNLSPATRVTLAKAQLALGQTNAATTNLEHAVKTNPKLVLDPKLKTLLNHR
jgi:tetratricopeptide (TPR) repeat protein